MVVHVRMCVAIKQTANPTNVLGLPQVCENWVEIPISHRSDFITFLAAEDRIRT